MQFSSSSERSHVLYFNAQIKFGKYQKYQLMSRPTPAKRTEPK